MFIVWMDKILHVNFKEDTHVQQERPLFIALIIACVFGIEKMITSGLAFLSDIARFMSPHLL
jgi:hypothetical protein